MEQSGQQRKQVGCRASQTEAEALVGFSRGWDGVVHGGPGVAWGQAAAQAHTMPVPPSPLAVPACSQGHTQDFLRTFRKPFSGQEAVTKSALGIVGDESSPSHFAGDRETKALRRRASHST